jgi:ABC-type uncharacterized transport system auxiliary subunit
MRYAAVAAMLLSTSCITIGLGGRSEPLSIYSLESPAPQTSPARTDLVLRLRDFTASSAYDRTDMVLVDSTGRTTRASAHRWASGPPNMLNDILARDLLVESRFSAVYRHTSATGEDLVLECYVREFGGRQLPDGKWLTVIEADLTVLDGRDGSLVRQWSCRVEDLLDGEGFDLFARSMSRASTEWSEMVRAGLDDAVSVLTGQSPR